MTKRKPLSVSIDMDTDKMQLKLRVIAKHAEALADELERIDNAEYCSKCGGGNIVTLYDGSDSIEGKWCEDCSQPFVLEDSD